MVARVGLARRQAAPVQLAGVGVVVAAAGTRVLQAKRLGLEADSEGRRWTDAQRLVVGAV